MSIKYVSFLLSALKHSRKWPFKNLVYITIDRLVLISTAKTFFQINTAVIDSLDNLLYTLNKQFDNIGVDIIVNL